MARGTGGDLSKALVPIIDPVTNCVTGWAFQVVGDVVPDDLEVVTLTVTDSQSIGSDLNVGEDVAISGDLSVNGNTNVQSLEIGELISTLLQRSINGGRFLQLSLTGIDTTAQPFIQGSSIYEVSEFIRLDVIVSNGTTRAFLAFSLQVGGTTTQNIVTGSETWQVRLNGDGSVDIRRTAGALIGQAVIRAMWL